METMEYTIVSIIYTTIYMIIYIAICVAVYRRLKNNYT